ncbi:MAG: putative DNA binding domain-containing protein [Gammaproteobacteria bacterium]|nr:putative DNA binding domain-containing protein [Gammaproteobacteria bacterium]
MTVSLSELKTWMDARENEHLEFKAARTSFHFETLVKYCVALANEGGGRMILGVTDRLPRAVVGSRAFSELDRTKAGLIERLRLRVDVEEIQHPNGRVLVFQIPSRPIGMPLHYNGAYWMRGGEALVPMTPDQLQRIFAEASPDFSAEICTQARLDDLDPTAVNALRKLWHRKSPDQDISTRPDGQLLTDAELLVDGEVTNAALILLGTRKALGKYLAQAELVFEYRSNEVPGPAAARREFRQGFLPVLDEIWRLIDQRNDLQHFQQGLFIWDVPTFNERVVREAVLNAVSHRDYRHGSSIFVRQYPRRIEIVSPGGFPAGITPENILRQQNPRNRRIAEVLGKCGLVERAGQGFDSIFRECIQQSKPLPDFSHTDAHIVWLTLNGEIQDPEFLRFLEEIGREKVALFGLDDLLLVDLIHREQLVSDELKPRIEHLLERGIIERMGRGRGARLLLSRQFYRYIGKAGVYTRKRGLDRETNKELLLKHIQDNRKEGSRLRELVQVLPALSYVQVQKLIQDLRAEGKIHRIGNTSSARWYPGSTSTAIMPEKV